MQMLIQWTPIKISEVLVKSWPGAHTLRKKSGRYRKIGVCHGGRSGIKQILRDSSHLSLDIAVSFGQLLLWEGLPSRCPWLVTTWP